MTAVALSRRVFLLAAVFAYLQIALGGVVRVTGSGLGCPDWPLCHGRPYPPADLNAIIEYSHRTVGAITGVLIIATVVAAWAVFRTRRPAVAWLATASVIAVAVEGALGGVVVVSELKPWLVAVHGTFILLLSGSSVVATQSDESCRSWPLCDLSSVNTFALLHRGVALVAGVLLIVFLVAAYRRGLRFFAVATAIVLVLQVAIGAAAAITDAAAANGLHVAIATMVWSGVLTTALLALPRADRASAPVLQIQKTPV